MRRGNVKKIVVVFSVAEKIGWCTVEIIDGCGWCTVEIINGCRGVGGCIGF